MQSLFYQANFCAECGNPMTPRRWWQHRYLCDECAARLKRRGNAVVLMLLCGAATIGAFAWRGWSAHDSTAAKLPAASAFDAAAQLKPPRAETETRVLCGARTLRGTPCRHLVRPGERCAQHRGRPSLLDSAKTPAPAPTPILDAQPTAH